MSKKRVLVVDDEQNIRRILQASLDKAGYHALAAESAEEAISILAKEEVDCILSDVTMPGLSGYDLQLIVQEQYPDIPFVLMTAFGNIPQAIQAIKNGAYEYITKPFDLDHVKDVLAKSMKSDKEAAPRRLAKPKPIKGEFLAHSAKMQEIKAMLEQVADSRATVLITGESGTGKEVAARYLHQLSSRKDEPFIAISCAALPETLLESELFGHEKGAFTGADVAKPGRFELANKGSLFLDEVGDIPMPIQIKLLRVLQEREFERLGATKPTQVDVRLITATNVDLQAAVDAGTFRLDLLYRLQVVEVHLPPLRERREDILPFCEYFLRKYSDENGRVLKSVSPDALAALSAYTWPGNVRELENAMERATVMALPGESILEVKHLPPKMLAAA